MLATHLEGFRRDLGAVDPPILEAMKGNLFQRKLLPWAARYDSCKRACLESWATAKNNDVLPRSWALAGDLCYPQTYGVKYVRFLSLPNAVLNYP